MRTFGEIQIAETASEFRDKLIETLRKQRSGARPDEFANSYWILEGFGHEQLTKVIEFIRSFDTELAIPMFEADELEPRT